MNHKFRNQEWWDNKFMNLAVRMAKRNIGITSPNPTVGCVIVKDNIIISTGITAFTGRPHAESIAIKKAKDRTKGATLYVTLEPCSHFGKTGPCADLIIKSKIKRVVIATIDPDKRVSGSGIKKLKQAGIEVNLGILEKEAKEINNGFFTAKKLGRPFVTLKIATTLDGKIATKNFDSKWITNKKSRQYSHYLRARNDAILIGNNTAKKDNPVLNCRISGLEEKYYNPKRIIISNSLDLDLKSNLVKTAKNIPTYIITNNNDIKDHQKFLSYGIKIIYLKDKINFHILLQELYKLEINNLLVEGGNFVITNLLKEKLIDRLIWIKSNKIIGNDGIAAVGNLELKSLSKIQELELEFKRTGIREFEDDVVTIYDRNIEL